MEVKKFQDIKYEKDQQTGIVLVTFNTPKRKNAMSPYTFLELWSICPIDTFLSATLKPDHDHQQGIIPASAGTVLRRYLRSILRALHLPPCGQSVTIPVPEISAMLGELGPCPF